MFSESSLLAIFNILLMILTMASYQKFENSRSDSKICNKVCKKADAEIIRGET